MVGEHWICDKFGQIGNSKQLRFGPNFCLIWPQMSNFGTFPVIQLVENDAGQYCYHLKVIPRNTKDSGSIKLHRAGLIWPQNPHFGVFANIRFAARMIHGNIIHHLTVLPANMNDSILIKVQNTSFWTDISHCRLNFG